MSKINFLSKEFLGILKSKCCGAGVLVVMSPDFLGDAIRVTSPSSLIGTCNYQCKKCGEDCDVKEVRRQILKEE